MTTTKVPTKEQLLKAQRKWKQLLESVVEDGKIRKISQDGEVVAMVVPVDQYKLMNKVIKPDLGPYHVVNIHTGKHMGPYSTENDASIARAMSADEGWRKGITMSKARFDEHGELGYGLEALRVKKPGIV